MTSSETGVSAEEASRIASEFRMRWQERQAAQPKRRAWNTWQVVLAFGVLVVLVVVLFFPIRSCTETYPYPHSQHNYIWSTISWRVGPITVMRRLNEACKGDVQPKHAAGSVQP